MYLKISMKVTYLNQLSYAQQTTSVTTLMSKYNFLKILRKKRLCLKVPRHVSGELLKLPRTQFKGDLLVIEKAKTSPESKSISGVNQNICPQT